MKKIHSNVSLITSIGATSETEWTGVDSELHTANTEAPSCKLHPPSPRKVMLSFEGSFSFLNSLHFTYSLVSALCIAHYSITFFVSFPTNAITRAKCVAKWLAVRGSASFFIKPTEMIRSSQFYIFTYFRCTQAHALMLMRSTILMPSVPQCNACSMPDCVLGTSLPRVKKKGSWDLNKDISRK